MPTLTPTRYRLKVVHTFVAREATPEARSRASSPEEAATIARQMIPDDDREHFGVLLLDSQNRVNGYHEVSVGSLNASIVHPREVFRAAILMGAAHLILLHNHPSGDVTPSREDIQLTRQLRDGAKLLGLAVHDHVIISHASGEHVSLNARGLI